MCIVCVCVFGIHIFIGQRARYQEMKERTTEELEKENREGKRKRKKNTKENRKKVRFEHIRVKKE